LEKGRKQGACTVRKGKKGGNLHCKNRAESESLDCCKSVVTGKVESGKGALFEKEEGEARSVKKCQKVGWLYCWKRVASWKLPALEKGIEN
jgi:hypothetical protein